MTKKLAILIFGEFTLQVPDLYSLESARLESKIYGICGVDYRVFNQEFVGTSPALNLEIVPLNVRHHLDEICQKFVPPPTTRTTSF